MVSSSHDEDTENRGRMSTLSLPSIWATSALFRILLAHLASELSAAFPAVTRTGNDAPES
jgi:hypothetical protein